MPHRNGTAPELPRRLHALKYHPTRVSKNPNNLSIFSIFSYPRFKGFCSLIYAGGKVAGQQTTDRLPTRADGSLSDGRLGYMPLVGLKTGFVWIGSSNQPTRARWFERVASKHMSSACHDGHSVRDNCTDVSSVAWWWISKSGKFVFFFLFRRRRLHRVVHSTVIWYLHWAECETSTGGLQQQPSTVRSVHSFTGQDRPRICRVLPLISAYIPAMASHHERLVCEMKFKVSTRSHCTISLIFDEYYNRKTGHSVASREQSNHCRRTLMHTDTHVQDTLFSQHIVFFCHFALLRRLSNDLRLP